MTYKALLTEAQRAELITKIAELAPDDILLSALYETLQFRDRVMADLKKVGGFKEAKPTVTKTVTASTPQVTNTDTSNLKQEAAKRVPPKIAEAITNLLKGKPMILEDIAKAVKSSDQNTFGVLLTMTQRKLIQFDGKFYSYKGK
jgi:hypothetical protein